MAEEAAQNFIKEVWGLQGTAYLVVGLRYYSRFVHSGWGGLVWDDAIMLAAVVSIVYPNLHQHCLLTPRVPSLYTPQNR